MILSCLSFTPNVYAMNKDDFNNVYWYGFTWGSLTSLCLVYKQNSIPEINAEYLVSKLIQQAEVEIKDANLYKSLVNLTKKDTFKECQHLIQDL